MKLTAQEKSRMAADLAPFLLAMMPAGTSGNSTTVATLTPHRLDDVAVHTGTLATSQAPWALQVTTFNTHAANIDAHHPQVHDLVSANHTASGLTAGHVLKALSATTFGFASPAHGIVDAAYHTVTGSQWQLVGLTGANALGLLTPLADVSGATKEAILKSDASGYLTLVKVRVPTIDTASGALSLAPAGNSVTLPSAVAIGTDNYASQLTGWRATYAGEGDFRYLFTDEMHAKSFVADLEQALAGGQIISKSVAMLAQAFTAPAAGNTAALYVRDLPSAPNMAAFVSGDIVRLRTFSRSGGSLTIADCWGAVTGYIDGNGVNFSEGVQAWTFTRSAAPNAGAMAAGTVVAVDALVLDYGTTGTGFYEVNAIDGTYGQNSPYARIVKWTTHPATGSVVVGQFGNLRGAYGYAGTEYGLAVGEYGSGKANITIDPTNGVRLRSYSTDILQIKNSDGLGYIVGPLYLDTGGGIYQGSGTFASPTTGLKLWNDSGVGRIGGYTAGTIQWYGNTDGKLYAGAGNVWMDQNGLGFNAASGKLTGSTASWWYSGNRYLSMGTVVDLGVPTSGFIETRTGLPFNINADSFTFNSGAVWHAGNDGAGSTLDADTVDGVQAAAFALLAGATFTGNVGIGTAPSYPLHVVGSASITGSLASFGRGGGGGYDATISSGYVAALNAQPSFDVANNTSGLFGGYYYVGANVQAGKTVTNLYGLFCDTPAKTGTGTVTNAYGLYVNTPTIATNNYCGYFAGAVGIGIAPSKKLHVAGTILVDGDEGGLAGTIGFTDVSNTAARSSGVGTINFADTTHRTNVGFIKIYVGTTAYYCPIFAAG